MAGSVVPVPRTIGACAKRTFGAKLAPMQLSEFLKGERGRPAVLAAKIGVSASLVVQWGNGKPISPERAPSVECATAGAVPCEQQRPDITWHRVPDAEWPWHPEGRPLIDVARAVVSADAQAAA